MARRRQIYLEQQNEFKDKFLKKFNADTTKSLEAFRNGDPDFLLAELEKGKASLEAQVKEAARRDTAHSAYSAGSDGAQGRNPYSIN